ncbi:Methionine S-methyltransferase-like protein [Drosera capensis]
MKNGHLNIYILQGATIEASQYALNVIDAPRQSDLMVELIKKLKPQVVVTGIASFEAVTAAAFELLLNATREVGSRLFLDISDHFELSSLPSSNGVLKYLSGATLPSHAAIICGLLKNQVYSDLEVAFVISEEDAIIQALSRTVELLEGNTALTSQYYYGCLFHELLAFQLADRHPPAKRDSEAPKSMKMIEFSKSAVSVFSTAELSTADVDNNSALIHMDVDQTFLPIPSVVKTAIFESFARQNLSETETDVTSSIKQFVEVKYGFSTSTSLEFLYADCSLALFNKLVLCCTQEGGTFCFPAGTNGNFVSAAQLMGANVVKVATQSDVGFKLTDGSLVAVLEKVEKPWVYLCGPTISPTGLIYSNKEIESILSVCAKFGARVFIDTSFSGLEYNSQSWDAWNLEAILAKLYPLAKPSFNISLLGGLSLGMLTGGLTFGFLVINQSLLHDTCNSFQGLSKPHSTVKYAMKKLLSHTEQKNALVFSKERKEILENRSRQLRKTLESCGWDVLQPQGGISMVARPSAYLGKHLKLKGGSHKHEGNPGEVVADYEVKLEDSNIREAVLKATGLSINSGLWTGIPEYCRFTVSLEESEFKQALDRLSKLKDIVG